MRIGGPPGTLRAQNAWVRFLIQTAWNVKDFQITGGPAWAASDRYDIDAKTSDRAKFGQTRELLQALLEERFHLAVHREMKELPVLLLTIAKNGIKFEVSKRVDALLQPQAHPQLRLRQGRPLKPLVVP